MGGIKKETVSDAGRLDMLKHSADGLGVPALVLVRLGIWLENVGIRKCQVAEGVELCVARIK